MTSTTTPEIFNKVVFFRHILSFVDSHNDFSRVLELRLINTTADETVAVFSEELWQRSLRPAVAFPRLLLCCKTGKMLWLVDTVLRSCKGGGTTSGNNNNSIDVNSFTFEQEPVFRGRQSHFAGLTNADRGSARVEGPSFSGGRPRDNPLRAGATGTQSPDTTLLIEAAMALQLETVAFLLERCCADPNPYAQLEQVRERRAQRMHGGHAAPAVPGSGWQMPSFLVTLPPPATTSSTSAAAADAAAASMTQQQERVVLAPDDAEWSRQMRLLAGQGRSTKEEYNDEDQDDDEETKISKRRLSIFMDRKSWARASWQEAFSAIHWRQPYAPVSSAAGAWEAAAIEFLLANDHGQQDDDVTFYDPTSSSSSSSSSSEESKKSSSDAAASKKKRFPLPTIRRSVAAASPPVNFGINVPGARWHASLVMRIVAEKKNNKMSGGDNDDGELRQQVITKLFAAGARDYPVMWNGSSARTNALSACIVDMATEELRTRCGGDGSMMITVDERAAAAAALHQHRLRSMALLVHLARQHCSPEEVRRYLNANTAGISGETLLHAAVQNEEEDVVAFLLFTAGVDCAVGDGRGQTALYQHAARDGSISVVQLLLQADADRQQKQTGVASLVDVRADNGMTPLDAAVRGGASRELIQLLLNHCCDGQQQQQQQRVSGSNGAKLLCLTAEAVGCWADAKSSIFFQDAFPRRMIDIAELLILQGCDGKRDAFDGHGWFKQKLTAAEHCYSVALAHKRMHYSSSDMFKKIQGYLLQLLALLDPDAPREELLLEPSPPSSLPVKKKRKFMGA